MPLQFVDENNEKVYADPNNSPEKQLEQLRMEIAQANAEMLDMMLILTGGNA